MGTYMCVSPKDERGHTTFITTNPISEDSRAVLLLIEITLFPFSPRSTYDLAMATRRDATELRRRTYFFRDLNF